METEERGRLLIVLFLYERAVTGKTSIVSSSYLKKHRQLYYEPSQRLPLQQGRTLAAFFSRWHY
jgi:hypothetical protein